MRTLLLLACLYLGVACLPSTATAVAVDRVLKRVDYIVLGAGTAGSLIAERLSRDPTKTVLVVDWGRDDSNTYYTTPSVYKNIATGRPDHQTLVHNFFSFESIPGVNPNLVSSLETFVTKTLGGASSINGNFPQRFSVADMNLIAQMVNDSSWTFANTDALWRALENWNSSDPTGQHGYGGPITFNTFEERAQAIHTTLATAMSLVTGLPPCASINTGNNDCVGFGARNIIPGPTQQAQGTRSTPYDLLKSALNRPNLLLLSQAMALKVNIQETIIGPIAQSVSILNTLALGGATVETWYAAREIVSSLGAFGSPKLLMLSGVGPAPTLAQLGIPQIVNSPNVGQGLSSNLEFLMLFAKLSATGIPDPPYGPAPVDPTIPYGIIQTVIGRTPGSTRDNYEINLSLIRADQSGFAYNGVPIDIFGVTIGQTVVNTQGSMTLISGDPTTYPNVTYNLLTNPTLLLPLVTAWRQARQIMLTITGIDPTVAALQIDASASIPDSDSDLNVAMSLAALIKAPGWHDTSTAAMGSTPSVVLNSKFQVQTGVGSNVVRRLRVCDNSAMPIAPESHSAFAFAMMVGQKCGDTIVNDNL